MDNPTKCKMDKRTILTLCGLFLLAAFFAADIAILAAHVSRFVNEYAIPKGFTWEVFIQYWSASMWGIAGEAVAFFVFLGLFLFVSVKDKQADRETMAKGFEQLNNELPGKIAKAFRTEFKDVFESITSKDTTTITITIKKGQDGDNRI